MHRRKPSVFPSLSRRCKRVHVWRCLPLPHPLAALTRECSDGSLYVPCDYGTLASTTPHVLTFASCSSSLSQIRCPVCALVTEGTDTSDVIPNDDANRDGRGHAIHPGSLASTAPATITGVRVCAQHSTAVQGSRSTPVLPAEACAWTAFGNFLGVRVSVTTDQPGARRPGNEGDAHTKPHDACLCRSGSACRLAHFTAVGRLLDAEGVFAMQDSRDATPAAPLALSALFGGDVSVDAIGAPTSNLGASNVSHGQGAPGAPKAEGDRHWVMKGGGRGGQVDTLGTGRHATLGDGQQHASVTAAGGSTAHPTPYVDSNPERARGLERALERDASSMATAAVHESDTDHGVVKHGADTWGHTCVPMLRIAPAAHEAPAEPNPES